ncbi:MAG: AsmA family protein [Acidobacteriaceae bacterium]
MKKRWMKIAAAAAVALITILLLVPFFVNADTFRPTIQKELSSALRRNVTLGHISLSLLTGSLVANNISIADDPTFSSSPFLQATELRIGVQLGPLLFHRELQIQNFTVNSPSIQLIHAANGTWNFSSLANSSSPSSEKSSDAPPQLAVGQFKIENGSATLSSLPASGNPFQCTHVNLTIRNLSLTQSFPFTLSLQVADRGSLSLSGTAGPIAPNDTSLTPFDASFVVKHFNPVAAGAIQAKDGISMLANLTAHIQSVGGILTASGKASASQLKLASSGTPAPNPVDIAFNLSDNLSSRTGQLNDLAIASGEVATHITGTFRDDGAVPVVNLHLAAPNLPVDQVEQLLPAAGVKLPSGSRLSGGTINANLAITGPVDALTIAGPVELDNSQLAGFDLGSQIQGINPIQGTSGGTEIQKLYAEVNNSPQGTTFSNIDAEVPRIGSASGQGSVSPTEQLNFQLSARIAAISALGKMAGGFLGMGSNSSTGANGGGIPLTITGTASNPSIHANLGQMLKNATGGILGNSKGQNPINSLKGIFGR